MTREELKADYDAKLLAAKNAGNAWKAATEDQDTQEKLSEHTQALQEYLNDLLAMDP